MISPSTNRRPLNSAAYTAPAYALVPGRASGRPWIIAPHASKETRKIGSIAKRANIQKLANSPSQVTNGSNAARTPMLCPIFMGDALTISAATEHNTRLNALARRLRSSNSNFPMLLVT